jgi:16S rRNA (cytidine1402-2'-O)-methyltransferase
VTGTLFVVATPIGNLGDLSPRAAAVLRQVEVIAAEDSRETRKLVDHVGSKARLVSCHAHSDSRRIDEIVDLLRAGTDVAVTTDAGTPGISDPGPELVTRARAAGAAIVPVPGPSAVATALMASGLPGDRYVFMGFAPRKGPERAAWLARIRDSDVTVVCFEAPGRSPALLGDLCEACGPDRQALVGREMTKRFEEYRAGTLAQLATGFAGVEVRGEVTVVVARGEPKAVVLDRDEASAMARALVDAGLERSRVARAVSQVYGLSRNESYRLVAEDE